MTPWTAARQASLSITNSRSLLKLMFITSVMPSNHLILCRPHLLPPSIFPRIRVFSNELALHIRWPKYWSFTFSIRTDFLYDGLLDLLAVQGTLKSLLQHHSSKASILRHSAFFTVQMSSPGKCKRVITTFPYLKTPTTVTRSAFSKDIQEILEEFAAFNTVLSIFPPLVLPEACVILVPQPGIKPAVETQSLNPWTTREVPTVQFLTEHCLY